MPGGGRFNGRRKIIELCHGPMKQVGVFLHQLHGFQFFEQGLAGDLIDRFTAFFLKMPGIGNVTYIPHFVAEVLQVAVHHIKRYVRTGMAHMTFAADCGSADIHAHMTGCNGFEFFFLTAQGIIDSQVTHGSLLNRPVNIDRYSPAKMIKIV